MSADPNDAPHRKLDDWLAGVETDPQPVPVPDIVTRLREKAASCRGYSFHRKGDAAIAKALEDGAAEIERLRARITVLEGAVDRSIERGEARFIQC